MKEIEHIITRFKFIHPLWNAGNHEYRKRLKTELEKDFKKLEMLGVARHFGEAALYCGYQYPDEVVVDSVGRDGVGLKTEDVAAILGVPMENIFTESLFFKKEKKVKPKKLVITQTEGLWD